MENFNARVTDAGTGQPLAGMVVKFHLAGGRAVGAAVTNGQGVAIANSPPSTAPSTGRTVLGCCCADLQGDGTCSGVQAHGTIGLGTV
ncbi:hypothetical protein [Streptomyces sp. UNOC14_S4]|uniref:hypothetical protein n=1 Tax=Streptomyces sp. UNOC14_S4 TaxID=2872340 RepID=UPI001E621474|nr:hypothetical protein [Streptomyces sp. UNOC14_S4]MCC3771538.1 hypothetical protein [Streptomyces sp. UNOC14_S4]